MQHNRIKNSNWQEATSWLFTSVAEDLTSGRPTTNPASPKQFNWTVRVIPKYLDSTRHHARA